MGNHLSGQPYVIFLTETTETETNATHLSLLQHLIPTRLLFLLFQLFSTPAISADLQSISTKSRSPSIPVKTFFICSHDFCFSIVI